MTGAIELAVVLAVILLPLVAAVARHPKREEIRRRRDPRVRARQWTPTPGGPEPRLRQVARAARSYRRASRWF